MSLKYTLVATALGATALLSSAGYFMLPGGGLNAQSTPLQDGVLSAEEAEEAFFAITPPEPSAENADLVPHVSPEEAAAIAADFFARSAPSDAELAAMVPFAGKENVRIERCANYEPLAVADELVRANASADRRMKSEIYYRLNLNHVLDNGDCSCTGKLTSFEPVALILDQLKKQHGEPNGALFNEYMMESIRLNRAVERLCRGRF